MPPSAAIEVDKLTKIYNGSAAPALNSISLRIEKGFFFGLLGPNGAGKTTAVSILCGLMKPTAGAVSVFGLSFTKNKTEIKKLMGVVPQDIALYDSLTAGENLEYFGTLYGLRGDVLKLRITESLSIFGLEQSRNKMIKYFSGGMKRRINLAAGILNRPEILFLDEPTAGIDVQSRTVIAEYLKEINRQGTTVIYTSHMMEEAESLCSHIAVLDNGKIIADGTPAGLISRHQCSGLENLFLKLTGRKMRD